MLVRELLIKLGIMRDRGSFERANKGINQLKRAGQLLGAVFVTGAAARGFKSIIDSASAAEEQANKFAAVFLDAAGTTTAAVEDIARRTRQSSLEIEGMTANIGALVKPTLGSAQAAGKMGARVAELALDIASFNDLRPELALEKLRAGLIGSSEPLQSVGIDVREGSEGMKAYAESIGKTVKTLTGAEKIQARFNTILMGVTAQGALGDATKTADQYANAARALRSNIKQLGASIGRFFLTSLGKSVVKTRDMIRAAQEWIRVNRELIQQRVDRALRFISDALSTLGDLFGAVIDGWRQIGDLLGPVASKLLLVTGIVVALAAVIGFPILLMLALGAAVLAVAEDYAVFKRGGNSAIGFVIGRFEKLREELGSTREAIAALGGHLVSFFLRNLLGVGKESAIGFGKAFADVLNVVLRLFENLGNAIGAILGGPITAIAELLQGNFERAARAIQQSVGDVGTAFTDTMDILTGGAIAGGQARAGGAIATDVAQLLTTRAIGGIRRVPAAIAAGAAEARSDINAVSNIVITTPPGTEREAARGAVEASEREQSRRMRQAKAGTVGGGAN
jgi:hypothetical protein